MPQPDDGLFECDETFVTFRWPQWAVRHCGDHQITVTGEIEHGAYDVTFTLVDRSEGTDRELATFTLTIDSLERMLKIARVQEDRR